MDTTSLTTQNPVAAENPFSPASAEPAPTGRRRRGAELGPFRPRWGERLGGIGLLVAPLLFAGGFATAPVQTEEGTAGYIASLAADPALSLWSANLLHYGWVALVFGAFASIGLLRGRPGRIWLPLAAAILAFGAIQMSGLLLSDWFQIGIGSTVSAADAVAIDTAAKDWTVGVWQISGMAAGILGIGLLSLGLAKAKAISWWIAPLGFLPWVVPAVIPGPVGVAASVVCFAPLAVAGIRLVRAR